MAAATRLNPEENREDLPTYLSSRVPETLFYMLLSNMLDQTERQTNGKTSGISYTDTSLHSGFKHLYRRRIWCF